MPYALIDESFADHPKTLQVLDQPGGTDAIALWAMGLGYARRMARPDRPDEAGVISGSMVRRLMGERGRDAAELLVKFGLWETHQDGAYRYHDFIDWQQLRGWWARAEAAQRGGKTKQQHARADQFAYPDAEPMAQRHAEPMASAEATAQPSAEGVPISVHISSYQEGANAPSSSLAVQDRPELMRLCVLLADLIEGNGSKRPTITKTWLDSARLLLDKDLVRPDYPTPERRVLAAEACIRWCQADEFWRGNILSMPTLRRQFDKLRLSAARRPGGTRPRQESRVRAGAELLARLEAEGEQR